MVSAIYNSRCGSISSREAAKYFQPRVSKTMTEWPRSKNQIRTA